MITPYIQKKLIQIIWKMLGSYCDHLLF